MVSVVIPGYNEAENLIILLPRVHAAMRTLGQEFEILFVNNASKDNTDEVVRLFQKTMTQLKLLSEPTPGYGRAVNKGLAAARGEWLGIMRSDNQEKPEDLVRMFVELQKSGKALYKAIRLHRMNEGLNRVVVSFVYNMLFKILFGLRSTDINASPKVFTRELYEAVRLESLDFFTDAELMIKAEYLKAPIGEIGIEYLPRLKGRSSVRLKHVFEFLENMVWWRAHLRSKMRELGYAR